MIKSTATKAQSPARHAPAIIQNSATAVRRWKKYQHTRWLLTLFGIWSSVVSNQSRIARTVSKLCLPFPSIMILTVLIPNLCHVVVRDLTTDELFASLGPICYHTTIVLKNCILISRRETIKCCIEHVETDWRRVESQYERDIMIKNLNVGRDLTIIGVIGMFGSATFFTAKPLFSPSYANQLNQTVRPLTFPGADLFVDLRQGFNYEIVYVSNCVSIVFLHVVITAICNLAAFFVTHACGQIQIVMSRLDGLVDRDDCAIDIVIVKGRIAFIVQSHVRALRFASKVDAFLQEMCLMEVACSILVICWVEYNSVKVWLNRDFLGLATCFLMFISLSFNVFLFCHIGELLKNQCQQVRSAAYMIDWYKLPGKIGLALILIITTSNYPCTLSAGRIMELSHYRLGSIIRTSFAYLNMLRTMAE